ncbi:MAG: FG-GAP repeat protein [Turneriella sp.]|nr:FG-GAP repeat protein [Turneriella sp.]
MALSSILFLSVSVSPYCSKSDGGGSGEDNAKSAGALSWLAQAYLKAPNANAGDWFGEVVAASGDTVVIGARAEASNQNTITNGTGASGDNSSGYNGAVYVFRRTNGVWAQEAYLKTPNPSFTIQLGYSVAISGDTIVAGAPFEKSNQTTITNGSTASSDTSAGASGAAYVFKRTGTTWVQEAYLKAPNAETQDQFGISVAISGDTIVVGANQEDSNQATITNGSTASGNNSASNSGAAYVFKRTGSMWAHEAYLKAPNPEANDEFGIAVAISGDTVVVGAQYEDSNQTTITNGASASSNNGASNSGAAYVFKRSGSTWAHEAYLKAPNADADDSFGSSVSVSGDTIVVGAFDEDSNQTGITNGTTASANNTASGAGAAYVYKRTGAIWASEAYLKTSNHKQEHYFGNSVWILGDRIAVGAKKEGSLQTTVTNGSTADANSYAAINTGAAYTFVRSGSSWYQEAYFKAANAEQGDFFGSSVALAENILVVGALSESSNQTTITNGSTASTNNSATDAGAAYIFSRQ